MIKLPLSILISFFCYLQINGAEPFRVFKTPQGQSFEGRAVGYEGETFILANKSGKFFKVPLKALSQDDQSYLISGARLNRIPKGMPAKPSASPSPPGPRRAQNGT